MEYSGSELGEEVTIIAQQHRLMALLNIPEPCAGIILFAHGSGSGRFSTRNNFVARHLNDQGFATLLLDLLEPEEEEDRRNVFDISLLAGRLIAAHEWVAEQANLKGVPVGYFGASTGGGAALEAAACQKRKVKAVVSRGGRPDLAERFLHMVEAPTCLIVGSLDSGVIDLNRFAFDRLKCVKEMKIVPGATHLFSEPGALEEVADYAVEWFERFLASKPHVIPESKGVKRTYRQLEVER